MNRYRSKKTGESVVINSKESIVNVDRLGECLLDDGRIVVTPGIDLKKITPLASIPKNVPIVTPASTPTTFKK